VLCFHSRLVQSVDRSAGEDDRGLTLIRANRFGSNAASGRVLSKIGMAYQGTRPHYYEKWGEKEDRVEYILHARDWRRSLDG
jgi:RimJ/RimL family protein N-acetyltransferase